MNFEYASSAPGQIFPPQTDAYAQLLEPKQVLASTIRMVYLSGIEPLCHAVLNWMYPDDLPANPNTFQDGMLTYTEDSEVRYRYRRVRAETYNLLHAHYTRLALSRVPRPAYGKSYLMGDWEITYDPDANYWNPNHGWVATHKNYEASYEGPEDGWVGSHPIYFAANFYDICAVLEEEEGVSVWAGGSV